MKRFLVRTAGFVGLLAWFLGAPVSAAQVSPDREPFVFATFVDDPFSERKAALLVDSIRRFGGVHAGAPIFIAVKDLERMPLPNLRSHDAVVRGMNEGKDVYTLMREITLPPGSRVGQFYGRVSWSVRGIFEGYAGWFDGQPANLYDQPPTLADAELVRLAGGTQAVLARTRELLGAGDALLALRLAEAALAAEPGSVEATAARVEALTALRARSRNGVERNWLDFAAKP